MESNSNRGSTGQLSNSGSTGGAGTMSVAGMHHSHSTPAGVDGGGVRTPPATPKKGGKMLAIRIQMLDDTITIFQVQAKALGRVLFEQVCKQLHLLEADYFGLEYLDINGTRYWLDLEKPVCRQLGLSLVDPLLYFCVKFYTPDPGQLEEEYTRYLFCLQVKRDLSQGLMQCNENTAALMASYIVQAECGDYVAEDYPDHTYLSSYKFVPQQDHEMERKIMENHKKHTGQSPAEADLNLLETARRCELYGIKMHSAKDHENVPLNLAVAHMGIIVFQNYTKINTFSWAKIRKISFKRKRFLIKLHHEGYGCIKDTVEFFFEGRNECKNFWKKCVENHGFFRCASVNNVSRHKTRVLSRGSSFRYSGKTQKQMVEFVRDNYVKRQAFQRSASFRHSSAHSSASNMHSNTVGNSISAHPLLPLADSNLSVEVSKLGTSLGGSMGAVSGTGAGAPASPTTRLASRHRGTATCWSSTPDTRQPIATTQLAQTTTSLSPPLTTQSASPPTSATVTPHRRTPLEERTMPPATITPVAVHAAAVHRAADTGINIISTTTNSLRMPSNNKSEGILDHTFITNNYPLQTQSQNDLGFNQAQTQTSPEYNTTNNNINNINRSTVFSKRQIWQRSASCRDLYDFSFEDSGQAKRRIHNKPIEITSYITERKLESPITRYDDRPIYSTNLHQDNNLEIHQDIMMPVDQKVYSSSYPGTNSLYSQESVEDPGNYDLRDSQDDITHDSYELIEKSDDDTSGDYQRYKRIKLNVRSCSLDSGNYLPSDTDSDIDKRHKCKSSSDVYYDLFLYEDPRDFPREIVPRKSDGSFYKNFKINSRTSSLESKSDYYELKSKSSKESLKKPQTISPEYELIRRNKSADNLERHFIDSRTSSQESKSEYFDASSKVDESQFYSKHNFDRKINFERNYGTQKTKFIEYVPTYNSHVHSISLQNVEIEQNRSLLDHNTIPRTTQKINYKQDNQWPPSKQSTTTESESNIFSFDEDKIQSLQDSSDCGPNFSIVPPIPVNDLKDDITNKKQIFPEIEPRKLRESLPLHQPIERTKSDPNSLARKRINSNNSRRLLLMHQKSIDLTPAESSDEDYLFKQIPSAPPITPKHKYFDIPTAEFGHFDILKRGAEGQKTKFQVPKSQFDFLGVKTQSDFVNLPPKSEEIPYVLHKRHIINGTVGKDEKIETKQEQKEPDQFLFTQNIDLSKVNPVTLEIDKTGLPIQHLSSPKRDITHIDPVLLETLNSKLSQIESDSPTSSKTESLKKLLLPTQIKHEPKIETPKIEEEKITLKDKIKLVKPKRVIKPRIINKKNNKTNKTKVRITSFSSDDESLDSDDVFGSAEATPTRMEFSPPQMRKEMESILKFESERKYLQYTMSSTEVEGSPPTTRKKTVEKQVDNSIDPNVPSELRRISERSLSIPSSEDDLNVKTTDMQPVFGEPPEPLSTVPEHEREADDKSIEEIDLDKMEREKEKLLLQAEIEQDLKDLKVPSKTKITEIISPTLRRKGHSSLLFAHARLNLSEGSAFTLLQKQQAVDSPNSGRRTKSLDTPIVSVSRLPPVNAFSSKDDTVEEEDYQTDINESEGDETLKADLKLNEVIEKPVEMSIETLKKFKEKDNDQIVPNVSSKGKKTTKTVSGKTNKTKKPKTRVITKIVTKIDEKSSGHKSLKSHTSLLVPDIKEIKRAKSQEVESSKKIQTKEKAKSLDKLELKKCGSKERPKSQVESHTDIVKRKAKQQMLYETAIKQTKTIKSPVKDVLPVFPQVEEMVRERHGKLEISINTIENSNVSLEEAIIITKSPKKLDKKIDKKMTKSLELNLATDETNDIEDDKSFIRLGKSLDLDNRSNENESQAEFNFKTETINKIKDSDIVSPVYDLVQQVVKADVHKENIEENQHENIVLEGTSLDVWLSVDEKKDKLKNIQLIQKSSDFFEQGTSSKPPDLITTHEKLTVQDDQPTKEEMKKATDTMGKFLKKKLDNRKIVKESEQDDQPTKEEMKKATDTMGKFLKKKLDNRKIVKEVEQDDQPTKEEMKKATDTMGKFLKKKLDNRKIIKESEQDDQPTKEEMKKATDTMGKFLKKKLDNRKIVKEVEQDDQPTKEEMKKATDTMGKFLKKKLDNRKIVKKVEQDDQPTKEEMKKATDTMGKFLKKKLDNRKIVKESEQDDQPTKEEMKKAADTMGKFLKKKLDNRKIVKEVEQDDQPTKEEMEKATNTMGKFLKQKLEKRRIVLKPDDYNNKSEDEDKDTETMDNFLKKKIENFRNGKTSIQITSDESLTEVSDLNQESINNNNFLSVDDGHTDALLKLSIERSRSEDTGSWMTVECDEFVGIESSFEEIPAEILDKNQSDEKKTTINEEKKLLSSQSKENKLDILKRSSDQSRSSDTPSSWTSGEKETSLNNPKSTDDSSLSCTMGHTIGFSQVIEKFGTKEDSEPPKSPRSPRICVLGRTFTMDAETTFNKLEFHKDESTSANSQMIQDTAENSGIRFNKSPYPFEEKWGADSELSQKLQQKIVKKLSGDKSLSIEDSISERRRNLEKPSMNLIEKLSTESRNSIDTESSSGSLGAVSRLPKSGDIPRELSSTWKPFPLDSSGSESFDDALLPSDPSDKEYFMRRENSNDLMPLTDVCYKSDSDFTPTKDDTDLPEDLANFQASFAGYPCLTSNIGSIGLNLASGFLSRTLSRISERSTNSEKSSLEEESVKGSTQSDSLNGESSSNPQLSFSSDPPSHAHLSENDRKTPTNEVIQNKSIEKIPDTNISTLLQRQISDDRRTSAEMADLSIDDIEIITSERGLRLLRQSSEDTIIDEECYEKNDKKSSSSQDNSEDWPLPEIPQPNKNLLALHDLPSSDTSQQTTQIFQPPPQVQEKSLPQVFGLRGSLRSQDSEPWPSPPSSIAEPLIVNVETYYITPPEEACKVNVDLNTADSEKYADTDEKTHTYENVPCEVGSESISESLSIGAGIKIVLDTNKSDSDSNIYDEVFIDAVDVVKHELRPPTCMRRSSDDSSESKIKSCHASSENEDTSSIAEEGTVRFAAIKPTKCTHSSHSEDTSMALSLSEWSNSTATVKFQNLSSNSGTKSSGGLKSDDNSLTDIAQSLSEWSSSNSKHQSTSLQFQKLSSTTSDSTLTDRIATLSEWSSSDSKTLVPQSFFAIPEEDKKSPKNIPSEDYIQLMDKLELKNEITKYTKSTERPILIPIQTSDTDSSVDHACYEKKIQKSKSYERPTKIPPKLSKCHPSYYSSSLSSESVSISTISKTATVPLTRNHRKPITKSLFQARSPPSENDSTSSVESPKSKSERDRRGYRRRRQSQNQRKQKEKDQQEILDYNEYLRQKSYCDESLLNYHENIEEGYAPDGDSGSDIFRMEKDDDEINEGFDVNLIPPPLLEDDFEDEQFEKI